MTNLFINIAGDYDYETSIKAWSDRLKRPKLDSVYLSCLNMFSMAKITKILQQVKENFDLNDEIEITLECEPKELTLIYMRSLYGAGINRLSMAQPNCEDIIEGFNFFDSVNVDGRLFDGAQHLSRYDLNDFEQFEQVRLALAMQKFFPYDRYHFCQPGAVCQYLKNVLEYRPYLGIGPMAHSRLRINDQWIAVVDDDEKTLSEKEWIEEFLLQNFSLYPGVDRARFEKASNRSLDDCFDQELWQKWIDADAIGFSGNRIHLAGDMFFTPEKIVSGLKL